MTSTTSSLALFPGVALSPALARAAEDAARYVIESRSASTRRIYRVQWDAWRAHCAARGIPIVPVEPAELITYLTHRAASPSARTGRTNAPNSIRLALSAISVIDQRARVTESERHPRAVRSDPLVRDWLDGWSREHPRAPQRRAAAVTPAQLDLLIQTAQERPRGVSAGQHVAAYARDRCMLLLGIAGALRVSELVALDIADVLVMERGLRVFVRKGKTDQHGKGHYRGILPQSRTLRCPIDAWGCWLGRRGTWPGPAFVAVERDGCLGRTRLDESAARRMVTRRAKACGLELITSHSMRATFATLASAKGKSLPRIAQQGNWSSLDVLSGYVRQGELFEDSPTYGLLDD
jgi:integrase